MSHDRGATDAPVLFVDFDGVLHPLNCEQEELFTCVPLLEAVLRDFPEVRVVVSSSWREVRSLRELRGFFSADVAERIVDKTPSLPWREGRPFREAECAAWIAAHAPGARWLALDDDPALFGDGAACLMLLDPECGLVAEQEPVLRLRLAALHR
jgi:hypothetical protein